MSGKITVILLISVTTIFGIIFFYFQNFAYYSRVSNKEIIVVNNTQIKVKEYLGIRSDVSKLKLRGCFNVDPSLFEDFDINELNKAAKKLYFAG